VCHEVVELRKGLAASLAQHFPSRAFGSVMEYQDVDNFDRTSVHTFMESTCVPAGAVADGGSSLPGAFRVCELRRAKEYD